MKRIITAILCGALFLGVFASATQAQPMGQGGQFPGNYPQSYFEGQGSYAGGYGGGTGAMRTSLGGNYPEHLYLGFTGVDEGLGFQGSYFTLGGLFPFYYDPFGGTWYSDDRLHLSEEGGFFGNFGVGRRQKIGSTVHGLSFWYDVDADRPDNFGHTFHQLGGTMEVIDPLYEVRLNGYVPISNTDFQFGTAARPFFGNLMLIQPGFDIALAGMDGEFGFAIPGMEHWAAKAFAGYYFYDPLEKHGPVDGFGGGRIRVEFSPHHRVSMNLQVNHDDTFDTTGFLNMTWHFSGSRHPAVSSETLMPTRRADHILRVHQEPIIATNTITLRPFNVLHVNNLAPTGGDGTFEMPFNSLTAAQNNSMQHDLIYVHGTGQTYTNNIQLQPNQMLIGSGPGLVTVPTVEVGDFLVPSITDINPELNNAFGPSVFLADDNLIGRINFTGPTGIMGMGVNNVSLIANRFNGNAVDGANITNSTGVFQIQRNRFDGAGMNGLLITNSTGTFNILDNFFVNNNINGAHLLGVTGNALIARNQFGNNAQVFMANGTGMRVTATTGLLNVLYTQNIAFGDNVAANFQSMNVGTTLNTNVTNNNFTRNLSDALQFIANTGSTSNINVFNETMVSNGTAGGAAIRVISTNPFGGTPSIANVTIQDVTIDVGGAGIGAAAGVAFSDVGNANFFAVVDNLTVIDPIMLGSTGSGLDATFGNTTGTASTVTITNSSFTNVTNSGLSFSAGGLGAVQITNVVSNFNGTGISTASTSGILDVHIDNSIFNNNTGDGMNVAMSGAGVHILTVNNSTFNNNADHGFELHSMPTSSQFFGFFNSNAFLNNAGPQDFLAMIDTGPNPPIHLGTLVCLAFSQNVASSNYVLTNDANPANGEVATLLWEDDGTNVPGFTPTAMFGLLPTQVGLGTCAIGAAPFRLLPP